MSHTISRLPELARILPFLAVSAFATAAKTESFTVDVPKGSQAVANVIAIVPDAYDGTKPFPVLLLLHGAGNTEKDWPERTGNLAALADKHARIILCPSAGKLSWYNTHNGSEPFIVETVLPAAAQHYKLTEDRWIAGNSMGGYGTLRLFANHPKTFTAAAAFSPGSKPSRWVKNWGITPALGPSVKSGDEDTFTDAWFKKLPRDGRPLLMICGDKDFFFKDYNDCVEAAKKAGVPLITYPTKGDHSWKYWSDELPGALGKLAAAQRK
jgi:S-formylglutathione hydrolase FrmB